MVIFYKKYSDSYETLKDYENKKIKDIIPSVSNYMILINGKYSENLEHIIKEKDIIIIKSIPLGVL